MKKHLILAAFAVVALMGATAAPAMADEAADKAAAKDKLCSTMAQYAEVIMTNRQHGVSLQKMLDSTAVTDNEAIKPVARALIIAAYKQPAFSTEEVQEKTIREFTTEAQITCLDSMSKS